MAQDKKVIIYSTPVCPYCQAIKDYFNENDIKYTEKDVSSDKEARDEMVEKSQSKGVPVVDIDGEIITGFDKQKIASLLGID
ncbi:MAG: glutaredoxin family protein [Minisyncoccales bacterium]